MLMLGGLLLAVLDTARLPVFFRGAGVLWIVSGALLSYLAGRARGGDTRVPASRVGAVDRARLVLLVIVLGDDRAVWCGCSSWSS